MTTQTLKNTDALLADMQGDGLDRFAATFVVDHFAAVLRGRPAMLTDEVRSELVESMLDEDGDIESVTFLVTMLADRLEKNAA